MKDKTDKQLIKDIIDWDVVNWSKSIMFWQKKIDLKNKNYTCLELGGKRGGLSLFLAQKGNNVICSDLESPENLASELHRKYKAESRINYESIDATKIPYENKFDIVTFKSILGGISRDGNNWLKKITVNEIHKSLKLSGKLLFAENLEASFIHKFFRKRFVKWGVEWNYLKYNEIEEIFSSYSKLEYITVGFWGTFGRSETQRKFLGKIDSLFEKIIPESKRYIVIGIAEK
ncbi:MAG: methyltransferase domain-containing protein [Ignavibacterium sp.]|nr:MAG: methyltransferase domain-containing protein [Ignavibacterium sp.]